MYKELSRTYDIFTSWWMPDPLVSKQEWLAHWSVGLSLFKPETVRAVTDYMTEHRLKGDYAPTLYDFQYHCRSFERGTKVEDTFVSKQEEIAKKIIATLGFMMWDENVSFGEIADAFMIASCIIRTKSINHHGFTLTDEAFENLFAGRARMFAIESERWNTEAKEGRGYWANILGDDEGEKDLNRTSES